LEISSPAKFRPSFLFSRERPPSSAEMAESQRRIRCHIDPSIDFWRAARPARPMKGEASMATGQVQFHRVLRAPPERVYRAFLNADAMAKWLPPYGFTCQVHHLEASVGGGFRMSFTNFTTGNGHSFGGEYLELVPNERIRYTDKFDDPNLPGEMRVTVNLTKVSCGTELNIVQEGIPEVIPVEMCYLGWQESLAQLATLVEPEIPG